MPPEDLAIERRRYPPSLDPRLALLHSLGKEAVARLRQRELDDLKRLAERATAPLSAANERERAELATKRAQEIRGLMFSPMTTGVVLESKPFMRAAETSESEPLFSVMIIGDLGAADLRQLQCVPRSKTGDVLTAWIPWSRVQELGTTPGVRYVELARALKPSLGTAIPRSGIEALHVQGHEGTGVIVGIVDWVLDFHHPAFRDGTRSRVLFLWVQTVNDQQFPDSPPDVVTGPGGTFWLGGFQYGHEYDQNEISAQIASFENGGEPYVSVRHAPPKDVDEHSGHGTFVTGIAAGNGKGANPETPGAAPKSDIIFVHFHGESEELPLADSTYVKDAFHYIVRRAQALDMPCVVNLSYNDNQGAHDGTSALETTFEELVQPGVAITISAGNDNDEKWHTDGTLAPVGTGFEAELDLYVVGLEGRTEEVQIWFDTSEPFECQLGLEFVVGTTTTSVELIPWTASYPNPSSLPTALLNNNYVAGHFLPLLKDPRNDNGMIDLWLVSLDGNKLAKGHYFLRMRSTKALGFEAWVSASNTGTRWYSQAVRGTHTIGVPATARNVFAVAEHGYDDKTATPALKITSGRGPTRRGVDDQPVLAAPGPMSVPRPTSRKQYPVATLFYGSFHGTSASSALVAGTCALLFECLGKDTSHSVLADALTKDAIQPGASPWDLGWGLGYLQAQAACTPTLPESRWSDFHFEPDLLRNPISRIVIPPDPHDAGAFAVEVALRGSASEDRVEIRAAPGFSLEVELPFLCLPWRRLAELRTLGARKQRPLYRSRSSRDPFGAVREVLDEREATDRLDVFGVERAEISNGRATLRASRSRIVLEKLRITESAKPKLRIVVRGELREPRAIVARVAHFAGGAWRACVMLEARASS